MFTIRWDDSRLYVGAYIQETNLWATFTQPDSGIFRENGFEMLMDVDGSMFFYKQMQINVLGTMMDQVLINSPHDQGGGRYMTPFCGLYLKYSAVDLSAHRVGVKRWIWFN